jgi:hypothetical protein
MKWMRMHEMFRHENLIGTRDRFTTSGNHTLRGNAETHLLCLKEVRLYAGYFRAGDFVSGGNALFRYPYSLLAYRCLSNQWQLQTAPFNVTVEESEIMIRQMLHLVSKKNSKALQIWILLSP